MSSRVRAIVDARGRRHAAPPAGAPGREAGLTLIELLVTVAIMSVAMTAMMSTLMATVTNSSLTRDMSVADAEVRRFSEKLRVATYVSCAEIAVLATYDAAIGRTALPPTGPPTGWTVTITKIEFWNRNTAAGEKTNTTDFRTLDAYRIAGKCVPGAVPPQSTVDDKLQRITIEVQAPGGVKRTQQIMKRGS